MVYQQITKKSLISIIVWEGEGYCFCTLSFSFCTLWNLFNFRFCPYLKVTFEKCNPKIENLFGNFVFGKEKYVSAIFFRNFFQQFFFLELFFPNLTSSEISLEKCFFPFGIYFLDIIFLLPEFIFPSLFFPFESIFWSATYLMESIIRTTLIHLPKCFK